MSKGAEYHPEDRRRWRYSWTCLVDGCGFSLKQGSPGDVGGVAECKGKGRTTTIDDKGRTRHTIHEEGRHLLQQH